jgi:hypothetical protein
MTNVKFVVWPFLFLTQFTLESLPSLSEIQIENRSIITQEMISGTTMSQDHYLQPVIT